MVGTEKSYFLLTVEEEQTVEEPSLKQEVVVKAVEEQPLAPPKYEVRPTLGEK